jgi:flagellar assembly protein FliH
MSDPKIARYSFTQLESTAEDTDPKDVLAAAWAEAERVKAQARAEGEAAGRSEGLAQARADVSSALAGLADAIRALEGVRDELVETLTRQAAEIGLALGDQIVAAALEIEPERVVDIARGALRRLADRHRVTILVNPSDLESMGDAVTSLQTELGGIEHLDVQADRRVERGTIVQTEFGEVDASITSQLASARAIVAAALAGDDDDGVGERDEDDVVYAEVSLPDSEPLAAEVVPDGG